MTQEELEAFARARIGATLKDRWTLDELLGVGGTASVYGASHRNGKRVALKILHPELSAHEHFRERFLREAYVGNHIEHEGAVTVHDDDTTDDGCAFLVMDLLEGENLEIRRERKGGVLEPLEVLSLTDAVLDTLAAAHDKGVIHRDIKPENLFLTLENTVRLLDFGIARINVPESPGQTLAGVSMGTPAFMPPEQASAHWDKVDAQSDLWALGASMFTLLTGRYVHQGGTVNESLVLAVTQSAPKLENIDPSIPERVCAIVNRALHRDKSHRYKSAVEMQFDVRTAYRDLQLSDDDQRYSLSDGRLEMHSAPPAPVSQTGADLGFDPLAGELAADVATTESWRTGPLQSLTPKQRQAAVVGGAVVLLLGFFLLAFGGDDEQPVAENAAQNAEARAEKEPTMTAPAAADDGASADRGETLSEAARSALEVSELPTADDVDAGSEAGAERRSSSKRPATQRRGRPAPRGARPAVPAAAFPDPAKPAGPTPAADDDGSNAEDDFDPFAKRH